MEKTSVKYRVLEAARPYLENLTVKDLVVGISLKDDYTARIIAQSGIPHLIKFIPIFFFQSTTAFDRYDARRLSVAVIELRRLTITTSGNV